MSMSSPTGHANADLPAIDERLVASESGYEIDDGKLVRVPPSEPPPAIRHSKLSALLEAHASPEFEVASDMLMRLSETSDRAPDASVFPRAPDPRTGGQQLAHLAFEVANTESLSHAGKKAAQMCARGIRRVFAIDVQRSRALEWSHELGTWQMLDPDGTIDDPALAVPLPIAALVHSATADDAMARALLAKRNPVLVAVVEETLAKGVAEGRAKGVAEGRAKGVVEGMAKGVAEGELKAMAHAILRVLARRGVAVAAEQREHILGERDIARLETWLDAAVTCASTSELLR